MNGNRNYQKELDKILEDSQVRGSSLLLHGCCAPCSSYVLEYLRKWFKITLFYYNPNITDEAEYEKRANEAKRLVSCMNAEKPEDGQAVYPIAFVRGKYEPERFLQAVKGMETCPEGGERCRVCFRLRLAETAKMAQEGQFDYFTTTLSISPLKNAEMLNTIGEEIARDLNVRWLPSDFKKKGGYQRSVELSEKYGLYRQNYCGCIYSKRTQPLC